MPHKRIISMIIPTLSLAGLGLAHAEPCRALVNLRTPAGHSVLDVRFGEGAPQITTHRGLAAGSGPTVRQLRVLPGGDYKPTSNSTWMELQALDPATRATTTWAGKPMPAVPSDGPSGMDWWSSHRIGLGNILGPYITLSTHLYGYAGGAHDYDDGDWSLHRVPSGAAVDPLTLLEPTATLKAATRATSQAKLDEPPTLALKDLRTAALRLKGAQLQLSEIIFCCSWAENHNQFELIAPVPTPPALAPFVPDAEGWMTQGQCRVRHRDGALDLAWHKGQTQKSFKHPGRLIGVSWIDPGAPTLAAFKIDHAGATAAMKQARKWQGKAEAATIDALAERAFTLEPTANWIAEAGWLAFRNKNLDLAEGLTRRALTKAPASDHKAGGMIRYNLGRVMEARGDVPAAKALYQASLELRPHKAVQARLESLSK
jgi:tetratricopeptide (TPR) repeat protein